jgi:TolB-like protein/DNA-binding SARP family transcriptional activator
MKIHVKALGAFRVRVDGASLDSLEASRLRRTLLVILALERETTRTDILPLLWGSRPADRARHALSQALCDLRRLLGTEWLESAGDVLRVRPCVQSDVAEFRRLVERGEYAQALVLYGGEFLSTEPLAAAAPEFLAWLERWRAELSELHRRARLGRLGQLRSEGDLTAACVVARQWAELEPLADEPHLRLIELLAGSGHRVEALREYSVYERRKANAGERPGPELFALGERLREERRELRSPRIAARRRVVRRSAADTGRGGGITEAPPSAIKRLVGELQQRKVFRVAIAYCVVAFALLEVTDIVFPALLLPDSAMTLVAVLVILGFPVAIALAWAFDITPAGVRRVPGGSMPESGELWVLPRPRGLGVLVALVLIGGAGLFFWNRAGDDGTRGVPASAGTTLARVAVLYFDDLSEEQNLRYLADGLTETLVRELSTVSALTVTSLNGVKPFRLVSVSPDSIGRVLQVGSIVSGSVARAGDRVRVMVQLVDAATGVQLETRSVEHAAQEVFALQDHLAGEVALLLRQRLGQEIVLHRRRSGTESAGAWEWVQRAETRHTEAEELRQAGDLPSARAALIQADSMLGRAELVDPQWQEPILRRGWIELDLATLDLAGEPEPSRTASAAAVQRAIEHATRALVRRPADPEALELRGAARYRLWDSGLQPDPAATTLRDMAEIDLRAALATEADRPVALSTLSALLRKRGEFAAARVAAERAYRADEFLTGASDMILHLFQTNLDLEDHAQALHWCEEGRRRFPGQARFAACSLLVLAASTSVPADPRMARELAREYVEASVPHARAWNDVYSRLQVAAVLARAGQPETARRLLESSLADAPGPDVYGGVDYYTALAHLHLGERPEAVRALRRFLESQPQQREALARDWAFRELWNEPAFARLVEHTTALDR